MTSHPGTSPAFHDPETCNDFIGCTVLSVSSGKLLWCSLHTSEVPQISGMEFHTCLSVNNSTLITHTHTNTPSKVFWHRAPLHKALFYQAGSLGSQWMHFSQRQDGTQSKAGYPVACRHRVTFREQKPNGMNIGTPIISVSISKAHQNHTDGITTMWKEYVKPEAEYLNTFQCEMKLKQITVLVNQTRSH